MLSYITTKTCIYLLTKKNVFIIKYSRLISSYDIEVIEK